MVTNMEKNAQIQQLYHCRKLSTDEECELFEDALQDLDGNIEMEDVNQICQAFYDDTEDDELMSGMIHLIEQLISEEYLKCIALCTPAMKDAHDWAMTLNKRILNSQKYFEKYVEVIDGLEQEEKEKILNLLADVKQDNPDRFGEKVDMIYEKVSQ
ncbi:MAG: Imm30 family immunity protein [Lachnoclostridium sp.]|nr:Imm30 family immunity protein [Lachnoclostridium sp.]